MEQRETAWTSGYVMVAMVLTFFIGFFGALLYMGDAQADPFSDHSVHWNQTGTTSQILVELPYPRNCVWVNDCGFNPNAPSAPEVSPDPYKNWSRYVPIERVGWAVSVDNTEDSNATKSALYTKDHVIDNDPATIWHSRWVDPAVPMPHWVAIDLGQEHMVDSMIVTPRPWTGPDCAHCDNSNVENYEVWISTDNNIWARVAEGTLVFEQGAPQAILFSIPNSARYVRLDILSASGGTPAVAVGDIQITEMAPDVVISGGGVN